MKEALHLSQEQKLQQRLSPQQVQFVRLLEMSRPEMEDEVRHEIEDNPAIEAVDAHEMESLPTEDGGKFEESSEDMQRADYKNDDDIPSYRFEASNRSADDKVYDPVVVSENSLLDYLTEQINERDLTPEQQKIADYIIGNIDDNGYLTRSVTAISDDIIFQTGLNVTEDDVDNVLQMIRDLDPAGIGASDLRDCLLLQLERLGGKRRNMQAYEIIDKYFLEFSKKHYDKIMQAMGMEEGEFKEALATIRSLNPKPGSLFNGGDSDNSQHIIPDFSVEVDNGKITLTLLNNIPELQIEESFQVMYDNMSARKPANRNEAEASSFVKDKYESAATFIKMLRQRQETLFNTMRAIVDCQKEFFLTEDESTLKPMVLKDIAAMTGYDISVISRATAGKYVITQRGIYPLRFFFNEGLRHESGEDVSSREIQSALKKIVESENKKKPYSDEQLCSMLQSKGYEIARRTIAKYREKLGIPVARLRKELLK